MTHGIDIARRDILKAALYGGTGLALGAAGWSAVAAEVVNFADIGVGDPGGDWSRLARASGWTGVNLVAIGNAPSAILNTLVAGGGTASYDVINIVGGMQKPLVDNDLIEVIDTGRLPNWAKDKNIEEFLGKGTPGLQLHRLPGQGLRRSDRAAGRLLRLSARRRPARSIPTRALRSEMEGLCRARGQLHHRRPEDRALPQGEQAGDHRRPGQSDAGRGSRRSSTS